MAARYGKASVANRKRKDERTSPARARSARKVTKKRAAAPARKKTAPKRTAAPARKRAAKKRTAAPVAKKAAKKRAAAPARAKVAKKRAAAPVRKPAAPAHKKLAIRKLAMPPRRRVAPPMRDTTKPPPAFPPAFAQQRANANARELLLFELARARVNVMAAVQGVGPGTAMRPIAPGKWSPFEIVLHLAVRDRVRIDEIETALAGRPALWLKNDAADWKRVNEEHIAPLRHMNWDGAVRLLQTARAQLLAAILAVPAEPALLWTTDHPFGAMLHSLPAHDRHHAEQIKNARIEG